MTSPRSRFLRTVYGRWLRPWAAALVVILVCGALPVQAFCGIFVARADARLENTASQVVIAHSGDRNVVMMANDFQGDVRDFARIVPIPAVLRREQVRIGDGPLMAKLGAFTAPRLAQYFDRPCQQEHKWYRILGLLAIPFAAFFLIAWLRPDVNKLAILITLLSVAILVVMALPTVWNEVNRAGGTVLPSVSAVMVNDEFTVGDYDVAILNADESDQLVDWLQQNGYQVGPGATEMLQSYIEQGLRFLVVRVNLAESQKNNGQFLRPIVLDYESDEFMLPIRLGTLNAQGDQDLIVHILSPSAYGEVANYETLAVPTDAESRSRWPSGEEVPAFVQNEFGEFYGALFQRAYEQHRNAVFLEYATRTFGDNIKCDPCTVNPEAIPTIEDLRALGAWWSDESPETLITRLHVRYNSTDFPENLQFREIFPEDLVQKPGIVDRSFPQWAGVDFQARYVIRRPVGTAVCVARLRYRRRMGQAAENLVRLTGWDLGTVRQKMVVEQRLNAVDRTGKTLLHRAVMAGNTARVRSLVEQGANVNIAGNQLEGMTPLVSAIATNQPQITQLLLENGADTDVSWRGQPLLLWVIGYSDLATVQQLLEAGVNPATLALVWDTVQQSGNADLINTMAPYVPAERF